MALVVGQPTLENLEGDATALVDDFFKALVAEEPEERDIVVLNKINMEIVNTYKLKRLGKMFKMSRVKALQVINDCGGDEGLLVGIEINAGFTFADQNVPDSAALVGVGKRGSGETTTRVQRPRKQETISDLLNAEGTLLDEIVPEDCYAVITTDCALGLPIDQPEQQRFTDMLLEKYFERFLRFNLGRPLCRLLGAQIEKRLILGPNGDVPGEKRKWWKILYEKSRNRKQVRNFPSLPSPFLLSLSLTFKLAPA